jgi:hypothetical protein
MLPPDENPPLGRELNDGVLLAGLDAPPNPPERGVRVCGAALGAGADRGADLPPCSLDLPPGPFDSPCAGTPINRARAVASPIKAALQFICFFSVVNIGSLPFFPRRQLLDYDRSVEPATAELKAACCLMRVRFKAMRVIHCSMGVYELHLPFLTCLIHHLSLDRNPGMPGGPPALPGVPTIYRRKAPSQ